MAPGSWRTFSTPGATRIADALDAVAEELKAEQAAYEAKHPDEPATPLGDAAWWRGQFEKEVAVVARQAGVIESLRGQVLTSQKQYVRACENCDDMTSKRDALLSERDELREQAAQSKDS
jgi:hypothetical protein